jgi:hypothetical protein
MIPCESNSFEAPSARTVTPRVNHVSLKKYRRMSRYRAAKMKRIMDPYAMAEARGFSHDRRFEKNEW